MNYNVTKINVETGEEVNYGKCCEEDVKIITKGYKFNGLFYERRNSQIIYDVVPAI